MRRAQCLTFDNYDIREYVIGASCPAHLCISFSSVFHDRVDIFVEIDCADWIFFFEGFNWQEAFGPLRGWFHEAAYIQLCFSFGLFHS